MDMYESVSKLWRAAKSLEHAVWQLVGGVAQGSSDSEGHCSRSAVV